MPRVDVNGVELHYDIVGDGPPLLLLAGLGMHGGGWQPVVPALAARRRLILIDNRGCGRSVTPPGPYTVAQMAEEAVGVLDHIGLGSLDVLGHSMGGFMAMHIAATYPTRVRRLVLYGTANDCSVRGAIGLDSVERLWTRFPQIELGLLSRMLMPWLWAPQTLEDPDSVEALVALAVSNPWPQSRDGYRGQLRAVVDFRAASLLSRIVAPTLLLVGRHDVVTPVERAQELADALPTTRLMIGDGGHNMHSEVPEWFADSVLDWIVAEGE